MNTFLFPSFSGLLVLLSGGFKWVDGPDCIYMFGCTREGALETLALFSGTRHGNHLLNRQEIFKNLEVAEAQGRIIWRTQLNVMDGASERVTWLVDKLLGLGVEMSAPVDVSSEEYYHAGWNLPALRNFLATYAPSVVFCEGQWDFRKNNV